MTQGEQSGPEPDLAYALDGDDRDPIAVIASGGGVTFRSDEWVRFFGPPRPEAEHLGVLAAVHPEDVPTVENMFARATADHAVTAVVRLLTASGRFHRCNVTAQPIATLHGDATEWVVRVSDLDGRVRTIQALSAGLELRNRMLDAAVDSIVILNDDGVIVHANRAARSALSLDDSGGVGTPWSTLFPRGERVRAAHALSRAVGGHTSHFRATSSDAGLERHWHHTLSSLADAIGRRQGVLCVARDVTEHEQDVRRLRTVSETDALTGVLNSQTFRIRLRRLAAQAERESQSVGLLIVDMDYFKAVNDTLGHGAGDHLLRATVRRLVAAVPPGSLVGRLGGDEIAVAVLGYVDGPGLLGLGKDMVAAAAVPTTYAGRRMITTVTVGCALFPQDALDAEALLSFADAALNEQKATARGNVSIFDATMLARLNEEAHHVERARWVIAHDAVEVHYQPQISLSDGRITGLEALMRWRSADGELREPGLVGHAFGDYAIASDLGRMVRARTLSDMARWQADGMLVVPVAINVAPVELLHEDFAPQVLAELERFDIAPRWIEIEVTEHALADRGAELASAAVRTLRDAGVSIAIDDFGTGHSALSRLISYPVDTLKIDRSFVAHIGAGTQNRAVVAAIVALAGALGCRAVAEGIETTEQLAMLRESGCEYGQGFLIARPVDVVGATAVLAARGSD